MISAIANSDAERMREVINAGATAYLGVIPDDCWREPYMSLDELHGEIEAGVSFVGYFANRELQGVMGSQDVHDVTLIRHAYVRPEHQGRGIGHELLAHLLRETSRSILVGTWSSAVWAIRFYERHGFRLTSRHETRQLLDRYWTVPERQVEESVVLVGPALPE